MHQEARALHWDDRLRDDDKAFVTKLNESTAHLSKLRVVEITVSQPLAQSKIAWKLVSSQHTLVHRIVALVDGADSRRQSRLTDWPQPARLHRWWRHSHQRPNGTAMKLLPCHRMVSGAPASAMVSCITGLPLP